MKDSTKAQTGWAFINNKGDFCLEDPQDNSYLYFPLGNMSGMMSAITPTLGGDIKIGQNAFFMTPVSPEDLHNSRNTRNFWVYVKDKGPWSATGFSAAQISKSFTGDQEQTAMEAGFLWHKLIRESKAVGLKSEILNFVPVTEDKVELMKVTLTNTGSQALSITPTAAIPVYGRSADNIRDHRHVTSLLHRIFLYEKGVEVQPVLSFDERGHKTNKVSYMVYGAEGNGEAPVGMIPIVEDYIGEGGSLEWPRAIVENQQALSGAGQKFEGFEAIGALRFREVELAPGASVSYVLLMGVSEEGLNEGQWAQKYLSADAFAQELDKNKQYWEEKLSCCAFHSGDAQFDAWMKWVTIQPILRRIYGCSFLPHHDYGRGGRGWRDLWQDCLALLVMDPQEVRNLLYNNFAGVRMDGSNATIIGSKPGEFIADRNNIPRVWMDHGAWPFLTTLLYLDLSGDLSFLLEKQTYFKDALIHRSHKRDQNWSAAYGNKLKDTAGNVHQATILEHLILQNLVPFFNVGEHNNIKMEGADWNDALDMAEKGGESVAFTALYASNLKEISDLLLMMQKTLGVKSIELSSEIKALLGTVDYNSVSAKHDVLEAYYSKCGGSVTGSMETLDIEGLAANLKEKSDWMMEHIRKDEWITSKDGNSWFNGYYNNDAMRVEGDHAEGVRMTLTGQVFSVMGGVATDHQVAKVSKAVKAHLKDEKVGYRLNSRFHGLQNNLGRAFGFAFGHKENGAMFSHMTIMYGNALYKRGFVGDGNDVIQSIYNLCTDFDKSRIYPGIPEYVNEKGRGMYHYLTGSASWLILTVLTQIFGVRGRLGDLVIEPKLTKEQFDANGKASVETLFAGKKLVVVYQNAEKKDYSSYAIQEVLINGKGIEIPQGQKAVIIKREELVSDSGDVNTVEVFLG